MRRMTSLPDYGFYLDEYCGVSISPNDWHRLAIRAGEEIIAFERMFTVTGKERQRNKAVCAIADALHTFETVASQMIHADETGRVGAASVSVGSVSTSYKAPDVSALKLDLSDAGQQKAFYNALKKHMTVYRGVR